ncbi:MAG: hypothetical protein U1D30_09195 [Planctomycetota bacterium]
MLTPSPASLEMAGSEEGLTAAREQRRERLAEMESVASNIDDGGGGGGGTDASQGQRRYRRQV